MSGARCAARPDDVVRDRMTMVFAAACLGVMAGYRYWPESRVWTPAALAGIALAIWHGAYDTVLAGTLWRPRYAGRWVLPFAVSYAGLAAVVVLAWRVFPVAALAAFLLYSGVHFGTETDAGRGAGRLASAAALGCLPIAAACHWQASSVVPIFSIMLRGQGEAAQRIAAAAGCLMFPCVLVALAGAVRDGRAGVRGGVLVVSQLLLFRWCPPVLAFAVFFCALHTPEHLVETSRTEDGAFCLARLRRNLCEGLGPWLVALGAVSAAAWMGRHTVQAYTGVLFITLSALTVPHMTLAMLANGSGNGANGLGGRATGTPRSAERMVHP